MQEKAQSPIMQHFAYEHLPPHLKSTSEHFAKLADAIENNHMENQEKQVALRKLLEAKDAAVRSKLFTQKHSDPNVMSVSTDPMHNV